MKRLKKKITQTRLFLSSVFFLTLAPKASACVSEAPRHNNYLFSVFNRSLMQDRFTAATDQHWQRYLGNDNVTYRWSRNEIMDKATQENDTELTSYCRDLNSFLDTQLSYNAWEYPSKEDIAKRDATLRTLLQTAKAYNGNRLRPQYSLMAMRSLFGLKRYQEAIAHWNASGKRLPKSVYRDIMQNIYAGCLWRTGKKSQAIDIYASQEDYASLKYCVRGYRNLAGIEKVYAEHPNSPTLTYLVQDFVNNVQETMDVFQSGLCPFATTDSPNEQTLTEWMKDINAKKITTAEAERFIAFAHKVVSDGKTKQPCLWQTAIGCIEHQLGRYAEAKDDLGKAKKMKGTQRMKDNARAIYAANSIFADTRTPNNDQWLTREMRWLDTKSAEDRKSLTLYETDHYRDVLERMVYRGLVPRLMAEGRTNAALVLLSMANETNLLQDNAKARASSTTTNGGFMHNPDYHGTYFEALDNLPTDSLIGYAEYLKTRPANALESHAWQLAYRDSNYYADLIGTRLLAAGRFAEAVAYLEKVSASFLATQNIAPYASQRDYTKESWLVKQPVKTAEHQNGTGNSNANTTISTNKKLQYCHDMLRLQREIAITKQGEERRRKAYRLATMWYQGSHEGDCWWLKQYGLSVAQDSAKAGTMDFVAQAMALLGESAQSTDFELREKSLYALAFIRHGEPWFMTGWDEATKQYHSISNLRVLPQSRQYKAMEALTSFARENATKVSDYVTRCDMLKLFRQASQNN